MNIKIQQLKYFQLIIEKKGFRAAAEKANRSQAALSTAIKELERSLQQPLFEPGNSSKLTPFGELCLPKIMQFINVYDSLNDDLHSLSLGHQGTVKIASVPSVSTELIPSVLSIFSKKFPLTKVKLIDDNALGVEKRLLSGEVDLALSNCSTIDKKKIQFTPLFSDSIGIVCLRENSLAKFTSGVEWKKLLTQPFIRNGTCILLEPTPAKKLCTKSLYFIENINSLFSALELGIGITTLPKLAFLKYENTSKLVWIPLINPKLKRKIGIFRLKNISPSPQVQAFYQICKQQLIDNRRPTDNLT